jgi:Ser/Thr protein kinase RdoA (MazF antagonist)
MKIINVLNAHYPIRFDKHEELRDGGSTSYAVFSGGDKYFLRVVKPALFDTSIIGVNSQVFLRNKNFPVPPVIHTKDNLLYVEMETELYILYEYIEGVESDPEQDAEAIGELVGNLHRVMKDYHGELVKRDKHFFIGRYIDILRNREYSRAEEFFIYGEQLWDKIKDLPRGFCHGDVYSGNIHKTRDGKLYLLDFDTSCDGFPMYDPTLICDMTKYFHFDECNFDRSKRVLSRFISEYTKYHPLSQTEIDAFYYLIALQHFSTQATVMEIFGYDCLNDSELDYQLEWLNKWQKQCESEAEICRN